MWGLFRLPPRISNDKATVTAAVQAIKDSGLNYQLTGMGTQIEAENLEELYSAIANAQEAIFELGTELLSCV